MKYWSTKFVNLELLSNKTGKIYCGTENKFGRIPIGKETQIIEIDA